MTLRACPVTRARVTGRLLGAKSARSRGASSPSGDATSRSFLALPRDPLRGFASRARKRLPPKKTVFVAQRAATGGAYWLLDAIALANRYDKHVANVAFQVWTLTVNPDRTGTLVCSDGNRNAVYTQALDFTDFPLPEISLYFQNKTIFLPSEY